MAIINVIKNDGPGGVLLWKCADEDFNTGSKLIVAEGEEALFMRDGVIHEVFDAGAYKLETNNYPFIGKLRNAISGGVSAFNCKVYFVRTADNLQIKWGTESPIQLRDPVLDIPTTIHARGAYTARITNSKQFLVKYVGNKVDFVTVDMFKDGFKSAFRQKITTAIKGAFDKAGREILDVKNDLDMLAELCMPGLQPALDDYGVSMPNFYIEAMDIPLDDPNRVKLEEARMSRTTAKYRGQADSEYAKHVREQWDIIKESKALDIGSEAAKNPNGGVAAQGAQMGIGFAMAGMLGNSFANSAQNASAQNAGIPPQARGGATAVCSACNAVCAASAKFCPECGSQMAARKRFCAACGAQCELSVEFCHECGAAQE